MERARLVKGNDDDVDDDGGIRFFLAKYYHVLT